MSGNGIGNKGVPPVPQGPQDNPGPPSAPGPAGPPGEVSAQQLTDAIAGTSANSNAVDLLDPNADLPPVIEKINELIQAMRR